VPRDTVQKIGFMSDDDVDCDDAVCADRMREWERVDGRMSRVVSLAAFILVVVLDGIVCVVAVA
jgi:hypothetical protein